MPPRIRVDFTERELEALLPVLSNTIDHPDAMDAAFDSDRVGKAAALRANEKIVRAYRKSKTGSPADPDVYCRRCENRGKDTPGPGGQNFGCPGCGYTLGQHPNGLEARREARDDKLLDGYGAMLARREARGEA